ncbi:MAG: stage III sporulation protein AB [Romboutsia sp.]
MQIKIMVIAILVGCSYLIGEFIYNTYTKRHRQLFELIRILEMMRMDLSFGLYTLQEIFERIGKRNDLSFVNFFKNMDNDLAREENKVLEEILETNIKILINQSYLQDREVDEFKKLILVLGTSDIDSQTRMIDLSIENLKKITLETDDDINKKGVLYRKLSTIIGMAIAIILI